MADPDPRWPVYVINMADNTTRMAKAAAALNAQGIAFERFDAVVGATVSAAELARVYDPAANKTRFRYPLLPGEIGCYLSHLALWEKIANGPGAGAIILEDDFAAEPGLARVLAALDPASQGWDLLKLFTRRPGKKMLDTGPLCDGFDLARPYQVPNTTLGYALTKASAGHLCRVSVPFARPIDEDHKRFWEHGLRIKLVCPSPLRLGEEATVGSTIAASRKTARNPGRLGQGFKNISYRLAYLSRLHFYRATGRQ